MVENKAIKFQKVQTYNIIKKNENVEKFRICFQNLSMIDQISYRSLPMTKSIINWSLSTIDKLYYIYSFLKNIVMHSILKLENVTYCNYSKKKKYRLGMRVKVNCGKKK